MDKICLLEIVTLKSVTVSGNAIFGQNYLILPAEYHLMNPSFELLSGNADVSSGHLIVEAGLQGFSAVVLDDNNKIFSDIISYHGITVADYESVLNSEPLLHTAFNKTDIIWNIPESIITPSQYFNRETNGQALDLVFGDKHGAEVKSDFIYQQNVYNNYRVPSSLLQVYNTKFPSANYSHAFSLLLAGNCIKENGAFVIFYRHNVTLVIRKGGKLQFVKNVMFNTHEDAAYHLLNACKHADVNPAEMELILSGMIEEKSVLYNELYKYFVTITMYDMPEGYRLNENIKTYPVHFFSYLYLMAACV